MQRCYNIGCGQTFSSEENKEDSCRYHHQPPRFHDGKKGWECCAKYSTDFTVCLNMAGCTVGRHNPERPAEAEKQQLEEKYRQEVVVVAPQVRKKVERPSGDAEMVSLPLKVLPGVEAALDRMSKRLEKQRAAADNGSPDSNIIALGTTCTNVGCYVKYCGPETNKEICLFHNGEAIFHEGMKFWSCCQRKTTEFDSFMAQEGCTSGQHCWTAKTRALDCDPSLSCRLDWFQVGSSVTLTLYAKGLMPDSCRLQANAVRLHVEFQHEAGQTNFRRTFELCEPVQVETCTAKLSTTKLEIVLKKSLPTPWKNLEVRLTKNGSS